MSKLKGDIFAEANDEADKILDWLSQRKVSPQVATTALLITAAGIIVQSADNRTDFEHMLSDQHNVLSTAALEFFDAKEAEAATKQ